MSDIPALWINPARYGNDAQAIVDELAALNVIKRRHIALAATKLFPDDGERANAAMIAADRAFREAQAFEMLRVVDV